MSAYAADRVEIKAAGDDVVFLAKGGSFDETL